MARLFWRDFCGLATPSALWESGHFYFAPTQKQATVANHALVGYIVNAGFMHRPRPLMARRTFLASLTYTMLIVSSLAGAFLLRFEFDIPKSQIAYVLSGLWMVLLVKLPLFWMAGFERWWWRFVSIADLRRLLLGNILASVLFTVVSRVINGPAFPRSIYILDFLLCLQLTAGMRLSVRLYHETIGRELSRKAKGSVLIYGDGKVLTTQNTFNITFAPDLSPEAIRSTLEALACYYRACGGRGFEIDFEMEEVVEEGPMYVRA
jgi:hypothetical protein